MYTLSIENLPSLLYEVVAKLFLFDLSSFIDPLETCQSNTVLLNKAIMLIFWEDYAYLTVVVENCWPLIKIDQA